MTLNGKILRATVVDGWRLGCGCLYLLYIKKPGKKRLRSVVIPLDREVNKHECSTFHNGYKTP